MKSSIVRIFGTTTLALGLLATTPVLLAQRPNGMGAQAPQSGMQQNNNQQGMQPMGAQNNAQTAFLAHMRRNSTVETDLSKMAIKNSSNDQVKNLANQVISENRKNEMALTTAAQSNSGMGGMTFGEGTPSETRKAEKQMKKMNGTQFDQQYLSQMNGYVKDDQKAIADASDTMSSTELGSVLMQLRTANDERAKQIAQVAQSENFKVQ